MSCKWSPELSNPELVWHWLFFIRYSVFYFSALLAFIPSKAAFGALAITFTCQAGSRRKHERMENWALASSLLRSLLGIPTQNFCLYPIDQNFITWANLAVIDIWKWNVTVGMLSKVMILKKKVKMHIGRHYQSLLKYCEHEWKLIISGKITSALWLKSQS